MPSPSVGVRLRWLGLAALGTVFLATTTNVFCQEVAPTPVLWALPLALYLLSFIVTFEGGGQWARPRLMVTLWALGLAGVLMNVLMMPNISLLQAVVGFSLMQFSANVLCHGALYEARPAPGHLSSFYLWLAAGGALGTLAVAVLAPLLFDDYREFPLALLVMAVGVAWAMVKRAPPTQRGGRLAFGAVTVGLAIAVAFAFSTVIPSQRRSLRNYFGVLRVEEENAPGDPFHAFVLRHGHVAHGAQLTSPDRQDQPTSYYTWNSGLGVGLRALAGRGPLSVAVLGLGVGTVSALLGADDRVEFYDIDPNVVSLARGEGGYFHYLERAKPAVSVTLGDARRALQVELAQSAPKRDLLVVDVFSGDAVPAHLFTVEAMDLYWQHLRPDGLLALHVSNRHLELERVAMGLAQARGLHAVLINSAAKDLSADSTWVLVAKDAALLARLQPDPSQVLVRTLPDPLVWTDDLNSVLPIIRLR
jgi:SAM-dependent methyltransferase